MHARHLAAPFVLVLGLSSLVGCGGGAVGSSSGTSSGDGQQNVAKTESQTIAEALFATPDPGFDGDVLEGLYQVSGFAVSPVRVRIESNAIILAYKSSGGSLLGMKSAAQIKSLSSGTPRWSVTTVDEPRETAEPCVDEKVIFHLLATTFTLEQSMPGTLRGNIPMSVTTGTCPVGGSDPGGATASVNVTGLTLTKIGK